MQNSQLFTLGAIICASQYLTGTHLVAITGFSLGLAIFFAVTEIKTQDEANQKRLNLFKEMAKTVEDAIDEVKKDFNEERSARKITKK